MDRFTISDDIYKDSLTMSEDSYKISDDLFKDVLSIDLDMLKQDIVDSYKISGRYWIWKIGAYVFRNFWHSMLVSSEMQINAPGLKYFNSYPTLEAISQEYEKLHPDKVGTRTQPSSYFAFANSLRKGDVVLACIGSKEIIGWGIVEGNYMYRPTRTFGCHYRNVSWHKVQMPFIFTNKQPMLYQAPNEETHHLKEALINKSFNEGLPLPFGFKDKCKIYPCMEIRKENNHTPITFVKEKNKQLGAIISSLLDSFL